LAASGADFVAAEALGTTFDTSHGETALGALVDAVGGRVLATHVDPSEAESAGVFGISHAVTGDPTSRQPTSMKTVVLADSETFAMRV
jgi:hypothetical protein